MVIELGNPEFSRNVRYLRKKYFLSKRALAKLVGISAISLRDLEEGKISARVTLHSLHRLCAIFDVSAERLVHTDLEQAMK